MQKSLLFGAIFTKLSNSNLSNYVGGRIYSEFPPDDAQFPYVILKLVGVVPIEDSFTASIDENMIQFSLYSTSTGMTEITTMHNYLITLFDDAVLTISGDTVVWCVNQGTTPLNPEPIVEDAASFVRHWAVEYSIMVQD